MPRLLVTGSAGFLGSSVCSAAKDRWQVFGTWHRSLPNDEGIHYVQVDLIDEAPLRIAFESIRPDVVIHAAAIADINTCETNEALAYRINVDAPARLAILCAESDIPLLFASTDLVFDGTGPRYREGDLTGPINQYGRYKQHAEQLLGERHQGSVICRLSPLMGYDHDGASGFLRPIVDALKANEIIRAFGDEIRTPVSVMDVSRFMLQLAEQFRENPSVDGPQTFHIAGPESLSRFDLTTMLAKAIGADLSLVAKTRQADVSFATARPKDVSLDISRAVEMGFDPQTLQTMLQAP